MLITACALVIAFFMKFLVPFSWAFNPTYLASLMLVGGAVILAGALFLNTFILAQFENLEQNLVPNVMMLARRDPILGIVRFSLFLFPLLSFVAGAVVGHLDIHYMDWLFFAWIVAFGIALDLLRDNWHRLVNFLNPSHLVEQFTHEAKKAIPNEKDEILWNSLDSLAEVTLRAVEKSKLALSTQALQTFPPIMHAFFSHSKSISHFVSDKKTEKGTGRDEASYTIFYLLQRLELINDKALRMRLETVCRQMIMTLGKIIVYSAQFDLSMVTFPTHFLTKFGLKAQQHHFDEVGVLTTSTLVEIARTILTDLDLTYAELQEPFQAIINGLDALAKGTFKKDKNTNIKVLIQPLVDLKSFFLTEKMAHHPDTPVIIAKIDNALAEFGALEDVMRAIPTLSDISPMEHPQA